MKKCNKLLLIIFLVLIKSYSKAQSTAGNNLYVLGNYLGWGTSGGPLPFAIGGTQYMSLTTAGLFGIGPGFSPAFRLDIDAGDINLNSATNGIRINGNYVLRHNNISSSIFIGVGAGSTGVSNTFVGAATAGAFNNTADLNTFVGYHSGYSNSSGSSNTFNGSFSGNSNTIGQQNTFSGSDAGRNNTDGDENSFYGGGAGYSNSSGSKNSYFGYNSGRDNSGGNNSCFGFKSGGAMTNRAI